MRCEFLTAAKQELAEAIQDYDRQRPGLGDALVEAVAQALAAIERNPFAWPKVSGATRSDRMARFPYQLIYEVEGDTAFIQAVAHLRRRPLYWQERP